MNLLFFFITLAVACLGAVIAIKLKVPAGAMVGSMAAVIAFNLLTDKGFFYKDLKVVMQMISGAMIGGKLGREDVKELKTIVLPVIILLVMMVVLNLAFGSAIYLASDLDIATSLFATTPGGVSDMALISQELGANTAYVAILLIIYSFCPPLFRMKMKKQAANNQVKETETQEKGEKITFIPVRFAGLILSAAAVGYLFYRLGVTAGAILGGMVGGAIFTLAAGKTVFPKQVRTGLQIVAGAFIGMNMTRESMANIGALIVPILIMIVGILAFVFLTSWLIHKLTGLDYATCMFSSTPGGLQEMALLAEDMGVNPLKVSVMQTCRLFFVISFFPTMIRLIHLLVAGS